MGKYSNLSCFDFMHFCIGEKNWWRKTEHVKYVMVMLVMMMIILVTVMIMLVMMMIMLVMRVHDLT